MKSFTDRLAWCMRHGDVTVADLHHWFGRPRATVRTWAIDARVPQGPSGKKAHLLLALLESRIRARAGFPIPVDLSVATRPNYVKKLRHGNSVRVSASPTAR